MLCILPACRIITENLFPGNGLLTVHSALEVVTTRTVFLLTTELKIRTLIEVSKETMKKALKSLNITVKVLAKRSNAMWDILLGR